MKRRAKDPNISPNLQYEVTMGKLKTKKGVKKRFKLTKKGKIKHSVCGKGHLMSNKKSSRLRRMRRKRILAGANQAKYLKRVLPYG